MIRHGTVPKVTFAALISTAFVVGARNVNSLAQLEAKLPILRGLLATKRTA